MINLTTGPVRLASEVIDEFHTKPISHRSSDFQNHYNEFRELITQKLNVKNLYLTQGSGTLANDIMVGQIKTLNEKGLVLSNGEFGNRLIDHANRANLNFFSHTVEWGKHFNIREIEGVVAKEDIKWILFAHCETSTGIVNDLEFFKNISLRKNLKCFVDCMSSMGTFSIDLSGIAMATASSGKGLCSMSGIALVFSNLSITDRQNIPRYFDLSVYEANNGIPFTLSSNQFMALKKATALNMNSEKWELQNVYSKSIFDALSPLGIIPFSNPSLRVFTIVQSKEDSVRLGDKLAKMGVQLSYESEYLVSRNWIQLALFGNYETNQIDLAIEKIKSLLK